MIGARFSKQNPVFVTDPASIANGQCFDQARIFAGNMIIDSAACFMPPLMEQIIVGGGYFFILWRGFDVTGRTDLFLKQPGLIVKAARIDKTAGAA